MVVRPYVAVGGPGGPGFDAADQHLQLRGRTPVLDPGGPLADHLPHVPAVLLDDDLKLPDDRADALVHGKPSFSLDQPPPGQTRPVEQGRAGLVGAGVQGEEPAHALSCPGKAAFPMNPDSISQ